MKLRLNVNVIDKNSLKDLLNETKSRGYKTLVICDKYFIKNKYVIDNIKILNI